MTACSLNVFPHLLVKDPVVHKITEGATVAEMLVSRGFSYIFQKGVRSIITLESSMMSRRISTEEARFVRPKEGENINVRIIPTGGDDSKNPLATILSIVVMVVASVVSFGGGAAFAGGFLEAGIAGTAAGSFGASLAFAGISVLGSLLVSAIAPPQVSSSTGSDSSNTDATIYSISGSSNTSNPYGPVPFMVGGSDKIYPVHIAEPYTEVAGEDEYLYCRFGMVGGHIEVDESTFKIGDTALTDYQDVEIAYCVDSDVEWTRPTLYANGQDIHQESLSLELSKDLGTVTKTTQPKTTVVSFDISLQGLAVIDSTTGDKAQTSVEFNVQIINKDTDAVVQDNDIKITGLYEAVTRFNYSYNVEEGLYTVIWTRITDDSDDSYLINDTNIVALRSISDNEGLIYDKLPPMAVFDIRIRANGQLNGTIDEFNFIANTKLPVWKPDSNSFVYELSDNPAWAFVHLLYGKQRLPRRRITSPLRYDTDKLLEWAELCELDDPENGKTPWRVNGFIDTTKSLFETIRDICSIGRGSMSMKGGKYSVAYDWYNDRVTQVFTPRNSNTFESKKVFTTKIEAVDVTFKSKEEGYVDTTVRVYNDEFDEYTAENVDKLSLLYVNDEEQAYMQGRFHMADIELRPEVFSFTTDVENIVCKRGDRIRVVSDVIMVGLGQAYIDELHRDEDGLIFYLRLDSDLLLGKDENYGYNIRTYDGSIFEGTIKSVEADGNYFLVYPEDRIEDNNKIVGGELLTYGYSDEGCGVDCIVTKIEADVDLAATITCREYNEALYRAGVDDIPDFDPGIQYPIELELAKPPVPEWLDMRSDETVMVLKPDGTLQTRVLITLAPTSGNIPTSGMRIDYRSSPDITYSGPEMPWQSSITQPTDNRTFIFYGLVGGQYYDFRFCSVSKYGVMSDWTIKERQEVIGDTSNPPDVGDIWADGLVIRWSYPDKPIDFAGYKVRQGLTGDWGLGQDTHEGLLTDNSIRIDNTYGSVLWMVKAVDFSGNESEGYAAITTEQINNPIENIVYQESEAPDFLGVKEGCVVFEGELVAEGTENFWGPDKAKFWGDDSDLFWEEGSYLAMVYGFKPTKTSIVGSHKLIVDANYYPVIQFRKYEGSVDIYVEEGWSMWSGSLDQTDPDFEYYFRLTFPAKDSQIVVEDITWLIDAPDVTETLYDVNISAEGTRLPIEGTYSLIKYINVLAQHLEAGGSAGAVMLEDKDVSGPMVSIVDSTGNKIAGKIDVQVVGIE